MRIVLLGSTGNIGQRLLAVALSDDHVVTAFVRDADKLKAQIGAHIPANVEIIEGDIEDDVKLASAIRDQDVLISAAGNPRDGLAYTVLFDKVVTMATEQMSPTARAWFFGDPLVLRVPDTELITADLPGLEQLGQTHLMNFRRLVDCPLNWSMMCPGPMSASPNTTRTKGLKISKNVWPMPRPGYTKWLPKRFTANAYTKLTPSLGVYYEDVARFVLDQLSSDSEYCRMRIGMALPRA